MITFALIDACQLKINLLESFFLKVAQLLPSSPNVFKIAYLVQAINIETPWGFGGLLLELLGGVLDYLKLVIAWKFVKLLINVLGSRL